MIKTKKTGQIERAENEKEIIRMLKEKQDQVKRDYETGAKKPMDVSGLMK